MDLGHSFVATRRAGVLLVALLFFLPIVGCSFWDHDRSARPVVAPLDATSATSKPADQELPPKQAAQLCLATAQEMQKNGRVEQAIYLYEKARQDDPTLKQPHTFLDYLDQHPTGNAEGGIRDTAAQVSKGSGSAQRGS